MTAIVRDVTTQLQEGDCGPVCLFMLLRSLGREVPLDELRRACETNASGTSARCLVAAARALGFSATGYRIRHASEVPSEWLPLIVHYAPEHYVLLEAVDDDGVAIIDPAHGRYRLTTAQFARLSSGVVLRVSQTRSS